VQHQRKHLLLVERRFSARSGAATCMHGYTRLQGPLHKYQFDLQQFERSVWFGVRACSGQHPFCMVCWGLSLILLPPPTP
jgi:hypothetical protein